MIEYCNSTNTNGILLSLDFKSCFNLISFDTILRSLEFFNFSDWIVRWTEILYRKYLIKIQNNGKFSENIPIERLVHQGGVNSVYLFLCVAEVLALTLRNNTEIKGIPVNEILYLLNQYADDMDTTSIDDEKSIHNIIKTIEDFKSQTGFTINYDKTKLYNMCSAKNSIAMCVEQSRVAWTDNPVNILGILVAHDDETNIKLNYEPLNEKTKNVLSSWRHRDLSLLGKVLVINTLVASQFIYKMLVLPRIPDNIVTKIEQLMVDYLWGGKKSKVPLEVMQRSGIQGGVKLVDLRLRDVALKVSWVQILANDEKTANLAYSFLDNDLKQWLLDCNIKKEDVVHVKIGNIGNTFSSHGRCIILTKKGTKI